MKTKNFFFAIGLLIGCSCLITSCYRDNYYNNNPGGNNNYRNNNNNNNNNTGYSFVFDEEFNGADHYNWSFTSPTDSTYAGINGGAYQFVDYSTTNYPVSTVSTNANVGGNFTVQTRIQSNNRMGLVFGYSSTDYGYALYIDSLGSYSLYKEGSSTVAATLIIPSTQDTLYALKKGGWNTVEVDQVNGNWTGFINGTQIFSIVARPVTGTGFGFKIVPATVGYADFLIVKSN